MLKSAGKCFVCQNLVMFEQSVDSSLSVDELIYLIECETFQFVVCRSRKCNRHYEKRRNPPLIVFSTHINHSVVHHSNYPDIFPLSKHLFHENVQFSKEYDADLLLQCRRWINNAQMILIVAGAGMSIDSGLGSFRLSEVSNTDSSGNQLLGCGLSVSDVNYKSNPEKAWYYDASIRRDALKYKPHSGYETLLTAFKSRNIDYFVLTSNIDGYFRRAGFDKDRIYETHGSIDYIQCGKLRTRRCNGVFAWPTSADSATDSLVVTDIELDDTNKVCDLSTVPVCPECKGKSRANISHEADNDKEIDTTIKHQQQQRFWKWIRSAHRQESDESRLKSYFDDDEKVKKEVFQSAGLSTSHKRKISSDNKMVLLIIEIGCGDSVHSLRRESELLLSDHQISGIPHSKLIRIDPNLDSLPSVSQERVAGFRLKAIDAISNLFVKTDKLDSETIDEQ